MDTLLGTESLSKILKENLLILNVDNCQLQKVGVVFLQKHKIFL